MVYTVDESISIGCLQSDPTYLYVLRSAIACSTRIPYFRIKELNDWGKFYLPISITLPEIFDQIRAIALFQIVVRHSNVQRIHSLCNVLSHRKQLECRGKVLVS